MNPLFSRMTQRYMPPMNKDVMEGLSVSAMDYIEEYLDSQIRSVCIGMPECISYVGLERCTSQEEYEEITKVRNNKRTFDLADSSIYLVRLLLKFVDDQGKVHDIPRNIQLPFVTRGGLMMIAGTQYHITPVLSDKIFTPGHNSIFVRLMQDRNKMFRMYHTVVENGKRETCYVIWAMIYRNPAASTGNSRPKTLLSHYLFAKYGFTETFRRYTGTVPLYGTDDITPERYPPDEWIIYESTGVQPTSCTDRVYQKTPVKLAIRKKDVTPATNPLVFGFFYVLDHFPQRFKAHSNYLDDTSLWMILIGLIRLGDSCGENKLYAFMREHFETIDPYLDSASKIKLAERGIELENYYDLLNFIQVNFNDMIRESEVNGLSVHGKNLEVLYYILYDLLYGFAIVKFKLNKVSNYRPLTYKDVTENLRRSVRMGAVFDLSSDKIVTEAVNYGGDHLYPKLTAVIAEQENRAGAARGSSDHVVVGPQHHLDLSMVTAGSILNTPKSNPTPVVRINPWIVLDKKTGTVLPNPKFEALIEANKPFFKF